MGNANYPKYNIQGNVDIQIKFNKVCYLPGETIEGWIILTPKFNLIEEIITHPQLYLRITQYQYYTYTVGSDTEHEVESLDLVSTNYNFEDFLNNNTSNSINVPINCILPNYSYPSIFFSSDSYVKHFFSIDYPYFKVKRTVMFIVKNNINFNTLNNTLKAPVECQKQYKKSKLFFNKGSCLLTVKMPKNYFLYNEKVEFNINLNCKELKIGIKKFKVSLYRREKKNLPLQRFKARRQNVVKIYFKDYIIKKKEDIYNITDFLLFSNINYNYGYSPCPYDIYKSFEAHGLFEVNESNFNFLYPSCVGGLLSVDYFIKVKVYFDSAWTFDENIDIPIDFFSIIENNNNNINNYNINYGNNFTTNNINNNSTNDGKNVTPQNSEINQINNLNNNSSLNNNCISNDLSAPPSLGANNLEENKNQDNKKDSLNMNDWVII